MVGDYLPYVCVKLGFGTFARTDGIPHVVVIIVLLFFVAYGVQSGKKMVVIVIVPKTDGTTDVVSVFSYGERSACLKIGISHGNQFFELLKQYKRDSTKACL